MFIAALFIILPNWKHPEPINCYSVKKGTELLKYATSWVSLKMHYAK